MNDYEFVTRINNILFWVESDLSEVHFIVECNEQNIERAMKIAEREFDKWVSANDKKDPYWGLGYIEIIDNALDDNDIWHQFYSRFD